MNPNPLTPAPNQDLPPISSPTPEPLPPLTRSDEASLTAQRADTLRALLYLLYIPLSIVLYIQVRRDAFHYFGAQKLDVPLTKMVLSALIQTTISRIAFFALTLGRAHRTLNLNPRVFALAHTVVQHLITLLFLVSIHSFYALVCDWATPIWVFTYRLTFWLGCALWLALATWDTTRAYKRCKPLLLSQSQS